MSSRFILPQGEQIMKYEIHYEILQRKKNWTVYTNYYGGGGVKENDVCVWGGAFNYDIL
jgi:hypothetical protein